MSDVAMDSAVMWSIFFVGISLVMSLLDLLHVLVNAIAVMCNNSNPMKILNRSKLIGYNQPTLYDLTTHFVELVALAMAFAILTDLAEYQGWIDTFKSDTMEYLKHLVSFYNND